MIAIWALAILSLLFFHQVEAFRSSILRRSISRLFAIEPLLTTEEFEAVTSKTVSKIPSVIDFQKSGCKPCIKVAPAYEALAKKYEGQANFYKVDADTSKEALGLMKTMGVRSVPTFHVWAAGEKVDSVQGAHVGTYLILTNILYTPACRSVFLNICRV